MIDCAERAVSQTRYVRRTPGKKGGKDNSCGPAQDLSGRLSRGALRQISFPPHVFLVQPTHHVTRTHTQHTPTLRRKRVKQSFKMNRFSGFACKRHDLAKTKAKLMDQRQADLERVSGPRRHRTMSVSMKSWPLRARRTSTRWPSAPRRPNTISPPSSSAASSAPVSSRSP